jgi:hypothetical protein
MFFSGTAHAQDDKPGKPPAKVDPGAKPPACDESHFECISPGITSGTAAFNQLLAHQIAGDQVMVQGIDILKLQEGTLNLIRSRNPLISLQELQKVVDDAKVSKPLRLRP